MSQQITLEVRESSCQ